VTIILCLASFWFGRLNDPYRRYDAMALAEDRAVLMTLRAGDTTNAIQRLEGYLDLSVYQAMRARPSVHGERREILDSTLRKVALYREQVPRPIDTSTNGLGVVQGQVDAFLHTIKEQPNTARGRVKSPAE
jgi:hypothetical protein